MPLFRRRADEPTVEENRADERTVDENTIVIPDLAAPASEPAVYPVESGLRVEPRREYEGSAVDRLRNNVPDGARLR